MEVGLSGVTGDHVVEPVEVEHKDGEEDVPTHLQETEELPVQEGTSRSDIATKWRVQVEKEKKNDIVSHV